MPPKDLHSFLTASSDPLSAMFRRVRVRAIVPKRSAFTSPWAVSVGGEFGAFYAVKSGQMYVTAGSGEPVLLRGGDIIVLLKGVEHVTADPPGTPARSPQEFLEKQEMRERRGIVRLRGEPTSVHFSGGFVEVDGLEPTVAALLPEIVVLRGDDERRPAHLGSILSILDAANELVESRDATTDMVATMIMVAAMHRALEDIRARAPEQLTTMLDPHVGPVIKLMCDHPERDWNMQNLADEAGLSRSMFHERFVGAAGVPPMTFLRRIRLDHGKQLLTRGAIDLTTVARRCGYASAAAFRREYGAAPAGISRSSEAAPPLADEQERD